MEEYFANNPEEQQGHEQDEDADDVQIVSRSTATPTIATGSMIVTPASSTPSMKGSKGTIGTKGVEGNIAPGGNNIGS